MLAYTKESMTICPITLREVSSRIVEEDGSIFLERYGVHGGKHLIEKSADFYRELDVNYKRQKGVFDKIMVDVTTKCNLRCPVCYRRPNESPDMDIAILRKLSRKWKGMIVSLCGGEPTVREDLPDVISMFSKRNSVFLITNGIRLADFSYLNVLKKMGLRYVSLSLNALSEDVLTKINGENLLSYKLQALDNLGRAGMQVVLATVLVRGVNEQELGGILKLCLDKRDFIRELRIRTMAPLGAYLDREKFCLSEMIDVVARHLHVNTDDLLKELQLKRAVNKLFQEEVFAMKCCSFDFHLRAKNKEIVSIVGGLDCVKEHCWPGPVNKISILTTLIKIYGIAMVWRGCLKFVFRKQALPWVHSRNILKIGLRVWPDINTIDMEENKRCRTGYWMDGEIFSFCHANIIKNSIIPRSQ